MGSSGQTPVCHMGSNPIQLIQHSPGRPRNYNYSVVNARVISVRGSNPLMWRSVNFNNEIKMKQACSLTVKHLV